MGYSSWTKYDLANGTKEGKEDFSKLPFTPFTEVSDDEQNELHEKTICDYTPSTEINTSTKQVNYFKFLCHKYAISVHIPKTSKESRIKINAILKGIESGRVKERCTGYSGRDAECLVGAMDQM